MNSKFMHKAVQDAWDNLPKGIAKSLVEDKRSAKRNLRVTTTYDGVTVTFRAEPTEVVGYVHMEADIRFGVQRNQPLPEPSD